MIQLLVQHFFLSNLFLISTVKRIACLLYEILIHTLFAKLSCMLDEDQCATACKKMECTFYIRR